MGQTREGGEKKFRAEFTLPKKKVTTLWASNLKEADKLAREEFWAWFKMEFPVKVEVSEL